MSSMSENATPPTPPVSTSPAAAAADADADAAAAATTAAAASTASAAAPVSTAHTTASVNTLSSRPKTGKKSGLPGNHGPSEIWACHITKNLIAETKKYAGTGVCNYCGEHIVAPSSGGTTKLWNHLNRCRAYKASNVDHSQGVLTTAAGQPSNWKFDQDKCHKALVMLIILCELPFSLVEKVAFRLFCDQLQPRFNLLHRTSVTEDCLKLFAAEKAKLRSVFKALCTRVCLTTDMWTSIQNLPYMAITAHFVDKDWKLQKRIISFSVFPHPHSGVNIAKALECSLLEWGLDKVFTITLDNAKNNDVCVQDLVTRLNRRNAFLLQGEFFHIRCFAHVLNLVVRAGLEDTKVIVKRLRRSVKYVRSSPSRFQAFKKCVEDESIPTKKYLCLDVKTRWNSSYLMINAALGFRKAFERLEDTDSFYKEKVDRVLDSDWNKLNSLHIFLKDFYEITMRVSGSRYVTSTTYMDEIKRTKVLLDLHIESEDHELRSMAMLMNEKFQKYCKIENVNQVLLAAMVLDPRNKMQYAIWMFKKYYGVHQVGGLVAQLKDFMSRLYNQYKLQDTPFGSNMSKRTSTDLETGMGNQQVSDCDRAEFNQYLMEIESVDALNDLDKYLQDGVELGDEHFDILDWWKGKLATYRGLALMARDILAIPITSVASECAFSTAKRVLDPFRSSLTPVTTEALVCSQDWLKYAISEVDPLDEKLEVLEKIEQVVIRDIENLSIGGGAIRGTVTS